MKTIWKERRNPRAPIMRCVLVTKDGRVHMFRGQSIPGVCHVELLSYQKIVNSSVLTWEITHADTTAVVTWKDDHGTGRPFPQSSWEAGFNWMAKRAPALTRETFEAFIREHFWQTADRWDAAREAEREFGGVAASEEATSTAKN